MSKIKSQDEFTIWSDTPWVEPESNCRYCGQKVEQSIDYCSSYCEEKDSVWHSAG